MPLLSASSMYSLPSTSIISLRVKRAMEAMVNMLSAMLGITLESSGVFAEYSMGSHFKRKPNV